MEVKYGNLMLSYMPEIINDMTFDEVFKIWIDNEVGQPDGRDVLSVAQEKGFSSVVEWRLATALRLGMDKKNWDLETIANPDVTLPQIIVGPFQGWQRFLTRHLETTFAQAMEIPEFFEWCKTHDRIVPLSEKFPLPTKLILYRRPDGTLIHVEGGHRICAVAYANKIGEPIDFYLDSVQAAVADVTEQDIKQMQEFLKQGTQK